MQNVVAENRAANRLKVKTSRIDSCRNEAKRNNFLSFHSICSDRRNNAGLSQPVLVHVDSNFRNPRLVQSSEAQLMLTRPSAPIENNFHYQNEYPPPPYEKLYQQK